MPWSQTETRGPFTSKHALSLSKCKKAKKLEALGVSISMENSWIKMQQDVTSISRDELNFLLDFTLKTV